MTSEGTTKHLPDLQRFERLKAAVELTVGDLVGEISGGTGVEVSRETIATLALVVVEKIERSAEDLEAFAAHAKRTTIQTEDVKLLTRRNPDLNQCLTAQNNERAGAKKTAVATKRKAKNDDQGKSGKSKQIRKDQLIN